jgi:exopolyphosphatase/pppGpp-phosphohydrolase
VAVARARFNHGDLRVFHHVADQTLAAARNQHVHVAADGHQRKCAFALGALKTYLGFIKNVLPTENELLAIYRYAKERFEEAALIPPKADASLAVGGTLRAVCTLLASERGEGYDENKPFTVTREDAVSLLQKIVSLDRKTKLTMLEKIPQRIHTVAPGLSVFLALLDTLSLTAFTVVSGGVREGYLEKIIKKEDGI